MQSITDYLVSQICENAILPDIRFQTLQIIIYSLFSIKLTGSISSNKFIVLFKKLYQEDGILSDVIDTVLSEPHPPFSFESFRQLLLFIVCDSTYAPYAPPYLQIYNCHCDSSLSVPLMTEMCLLHRIHIPSVAAILRTPSADASAAVSNAVLMALITSLQTSSDFMRLLSAISHSPLRVDSQTPLLLCELALVATNKSFVVQRRVGELLSSQLDHVIQSSVMCDERVIRALCCASALCNCGAAKTSRVMESMKRLTCSQEVESVRGVASLTLETICHLNDFKYAQTVIGDVFSPQLLFFLFSDQVGSVRLPLSEPTIVSQIPLPVFLLPCIVSHQQSGNPVPGGSSAVDSPPSSAFPSTPLRIVLAHHRIRIHSASSLHRPFRLLSSRPVLSHGAARSRTEHAMRFGAASLRSTLLDRHSLLHSFVYLFPLSSTPSPERRPRPSSGADGVSAAERGRKALQRRSASDPCSLHDAVSLRSDYDASRSQSTGTSRGVAQQSVRVRPVGSNPAAPLHPVAAEDAGGRGRNAGVD